MNREDSIILLKHALGGLKSPPYIVKFNVLDEDLSLPPGTTLELLGEAAAKAGFEIIEQGETLAELRKLPPPPSRLTRA